MVNPKKRANSIHKNTESRFDRVPYFGLAELICQLYYTRVLMYFFTQQLQGFGT